jgi:site-specific DNA-adenine methylase
VWQRWGNPTWYYEPFCGSAAVLLARPHPGKHETIGYVDGLVTNFFRAVQVAPDAVAEAADWPRNSLDLRARIKYLRVQRPELVAKLADDPDYFDAKLAGLYAYCQSSAIHGSQRSSALRLYRHHRLHSCRERGNLYGYYRDLAERLRDVTVFYGNWSRLARAARHCARMGDDVTVFLDPPYPAGTRKYKVYRYDSGTVAHRVHRWALAAARYGIKVALCGYVGSYDMPKTWEEYAWESRYGRGRERIWFSP